MVSGKATTVASATPIKDQQNSLSTAANCFIQLNISHPTNARILTAWEKGVPPPRNTSPGFQVSKFGVQFQDDPSNAVDHFQPPSLQVGEISHKPLPYSAAGRPSSRRRKGGRTFQFKGRSGQDPDAKPSCLTRSQKTVRLLDFLASARLVLAFSSLPALAILGLHRGRRWIPGHERP